MAWKEAVCPGSIQPTVELFDCDATGGEKLQVKYSIS